MDGADQMSIKSECSLNVEHLAWQGWFEILDETESLATN
jgi:hypothetical protein